jgi:hypothetical protein
MSEILLDRTEALQLLSDIVEKEGEDHIAPGNYADAEGEPVCIVGHVLDRKGVLSDFMEAMYGSSSKYKTITSLVKNHSWVHGNGLKYKVPHTDLYLTGDALMVLDRAQKEQDAGHYWGEAVQSARNEKVSPL